MITAVRSGWFVLRLRIAIKFLPRNLRGCTIFFWTEELKRQSQLAVWAAAVEEWESMASNAPNN